MRKNRLNARGYATMKGIAENALKTIRKIKDCATLSTESHGNSISERPDFDYIFFDYHELRIICYDYTFSAWENFLEHIGFILFDDWDSKKKQRKYKDKIKKLLEFDDILGGEISEERRQSLKSKWVELINSIKLPDYASKRNPLKHIHADRHDTKTQTTDTITPIVMQPEKFNQFNQDTIFSFTDEECTEFYREFIKNFTEIHKYINEHKSIFKIYQSSDQSDKTLERKALLRTFLFAPRSTHFYTNI